MRPTAVRLTVLAIATLLSWPAAAQQAQTSPDHLKQLRDCRGIADGAARLACYDTAVGSVVAASDKGDLKIVDAADIKKTRRGLFGFQLPDLGIFGGGDEEEDMTVLETKVTGVRYTASDSFLFTTTEGATWQVLNAPSRLNEVKVGNDVVFKRAALGSYFIRIAGQIGVKGKRVR